MRHCALLLTAIFSRGEPMPVHYFEQLGSNFVSFVLDYIEVRFIGYLIVFLGYMIKGYRSTGPSYRGQRARDTRRVRWPGPRLQPSVPRHLN